MPVVNLSLAQYRVICAINHKHVSTLEANKKKKDKWKRYEPLQSSALLC
jgi:hypothetical protein